MFVTGPAPDPVVPVAHLASAEHTHWFVSDRATADLDGDGVRETVLLREPDRGRPEVDVHYADGRVETSRPPRRFDGERLLPFPVNGRPGDELLVTDIVSYRISVWTYRDQQWQRLEVEPPGLFRTSIGADGHGYDVLTQNDELVSYRSVEPFDVGYDDAFPPSPVYPVETWRWRYRHQRLTPTPGEQMCVSEDVSGQLIHCP